MVCNGNSASFKTTQFQMLVWKLEQNFNRKYNFFTLKRKVIGLLLLSSARLLKLRFFSHGKIFARDHNVGVTNARSVKI